MSCARQFPDSETETQKSGDAPNGAHKDIRDKLRRLLPSNIFVQILTGPPELRTGIFGSMLKLIALTTLVVFPILLLLLLQIQFLSFHDWKITWAQRAALLLDIVLLWLLRPPILADLSLETFGRARILARLLRSFGLVLAEVMSIVVLLFSTVVATIPDELQEPVLAALDSPRWRRIDVAAFGKEETKLVSTHDLLFAGQVDKTTRTRKSLFSSTLVLPGFNHYDALKFDDPGKIAWKQHLFDLRGRHLERSRIGWRRSHQGRFIRRAASGRVVRRGGPSGRVARRRAASGRVVRRGGPSGRVDQRGAASGRLARPRAPSGRVAHRRRPQ